MAHQVFISYANEKGNRNNRDFRVAKDICNALEAKDIRCWMAPRDIPSGADWLEAMLETVEKSRLVVLVLSSNANQSEWVKDEISMALDKKIAIIPFRIENISPEGRLKVLKLERNEWQTIRNKLKESHILFLLDELDFGSQCGITYSDLALFRAICDSNRDFKMVAVSRVPLKKIFPDTGIGSPAFNFLVPFTLGPLTEKEARQLLNHPWVPDAPLFDEEICEFLVELTGCHPYKLQRAAFYRFEAMADPAYDWQSGYKQDMEQML